jgi:vitamin B12 transporter
MPVENTYMKRTLLAAALLAASMAAQADAGRPDPVGTQDLDAVIVTATRTAITVDESLAAVSVIDREDIDRLQPLTVTDLLTGLPAQQVVAAGGEAE